MLQKYFKFDELNTSFRQETLGGLTTFATMLYIVVVNPKILEAAGIPFGPSMAATILTIFFGTLLMGVYAKRPFAIAPYMGQNAFVAFTLVKVMGYSWQVALGGIFISGLVFSLLTLTHIRSWLVNSIPHELKIAFSVGLGLFLSFIGLTASGIIEMGVPDAPVRIGHLSRPEVMLAILGFLLIGGLVIQRVKGAIFMGVIGITLLAILLGLIRVPVAIMSPPPDIRPILGQMDIGGALHFKFLPIVLLMLVLVFVDTMGTLIGMSLRAGFLDEKGNLPEIEKPMLCDALSTMTGAFLGTTTSGAYLESLAGIEAGGRSGFSAVVTAFLFLPALFFAPLFALVPAYAYAPALIVVGMLMLSTIKRLNVDDMTELIPSFTTIVMITFTYNLGIGMTAGFIVYTLVKVLSGRIKEIAPAVWILAIVSALFFIFYPY
ncbi:MAG TPA: NCS2 family permease [Coleofasciculaceae cyanobacterium]|jgi:AGZA family xanthine/uracil permease-like MFS transporter